jgi:hypothetical protein
MDVSRPLTLAVTTLLVAMLSTLSSAQLVFSQYGPAARQSTKPRDGFLDFTLKRVNPADRDYGQCIDEKRALLFEETIENGYFWSNVVALGLLGSLFIIIVYQHRVQSRREWRAGDILGQYERTLARANAQVDEATSKNHSYKEILAALRESALRSPSLPAESQGRATPPAAKTRATGTQDAPVTPLRTSPGNARSSRATSTVTATESVDQIGLLKSDSDLIMKINSLEQQLAQSQEDNKQLRRRIADGDRRLETEQQKNRQLKGA